MDFNNALSKILGNNKKFNEVQIDSRVIDEITKIAVNADPKEYVALLSGKIDEEILKITGLIFLPFEASENSAVMQVFMMPLKTDAVGSIHSHPGPSNRPSNADKIFFGKNGYFHLIICRPYTASNIAAYDAFGEPMNYSVVDLADEIELKEWDDLDMDKELFDEELLAELERLEKEEDSKEEFNQEILDKQSTLDDISNNLNNKQEEKYFINSTSNTYRENLNKNNMEEKNMDNNKQENIRKAKNAEVVEPRIPKMVNIQIEANGQMIEKQLPVPPEFEEGDNLIVDVRTDRTPGDSIDEIILNVQKSPENLAKHQISESKDNKSSEQIDDEIKAMEEDIKRLKAENERLRKGL